MRSYGIIPAAGLSVRMGEPKLLMPWGKSTVIEQVVTSWQSSQVDSLVVVVRPDDDAVRAVLNSLDVHLAVPAAAPAEMKHSVQLGLQYIQEHFAPTDADAWLLSPADTPNISSAHINTVLAAFRADHSCRRSHQRWRDVL